MRSTLSPVSCVRRPATLTRGSLPYLYRIDGLHPNARGYERWTAVIKPLLEEAARNRS